MMYLCIYLFIQFTFHPSQQRLRVAYNMKVEKLKNRRGTRGPKACLA